MYSVATLAGLWRDVLGGQDPVINRVLSLLCRVTSQYEFRSLEVLPSSRQIRVPYAALYGQASGGKSVKTRLCRLWDAKRCFCSPSPLWCPSLGAPSSYPSRLPLDPPLHKIGHFRDVLPSQSLDLPLKN